MLCYTARGRVQIALQKIRKFATIKSTNNAALASLGAHGVVVSYSPPTRMTRVRFPVRLNPIAVFFFVSFPAVSLLLDERLTLALLAGVCSASGRPAGPRALTSWRFACARLHSPFFVCAMSCSIHTVAGMWLARCSAAGPSWGMWLAVHTHVMSTRHALAPRRLAGYATHRSSR